MHQIVFLLDDVSKYVKNKADCKADRKVSHKIGDVWEFDNYGNLIRSKIDATKDSAGSVTHHEDGNMNSIFLYHVQRHTQFAVHKSCWLVCNKPTPTDLAELKAPDFGYKGHRCLQYQGQDFDMNGFITDNADKSWMLEDPLTNEKNKIRVLSHYHRFK